VQELAAQFVQFGVIASQALLLRVNPGLQTLQSVESKHCQQLVTGQIAAQCPLVALTELRVYPVIQFAQVLLVKQ
jgi:hypothetical protein